LKFVLFVEGYTEQKAVPGFFKRWLDPQLTQRIGIQAVRFEGWNEFIKKIGNRARMHLEGPGGSDIIAAIGLMDLYGPTFFPDHLSSAQERLGWAVNDIEKKVNHPKFRMFFAVHELEAWILSQPQLLPTTVRNALSGKVALPESINFNEPPAKLLEKLYRSSTGGDYKKLAYGNALFGSLNPSVACQKCPHLKSMLDEMLRLAKASGN
jgi:Domain of unknown function (DUF4276)